MPFDNRPGTFTIATAFPDNRAIGIRTQTLGDVSSAVQLEDNDHARANILWNVQRAGNRWTITQLGGTKSLYPENRQAEPGDEIEATNSDGTAIFEWEIVTYEGGYSKVKNGATNLFLMVDSGDYEDRPELDNDSMAINRGWFFTRI
jgi:hypothetical protein